MYECGSRTIKKPERQRIDAFELRFWRRLWRVPWIAKRSKWSILKGDFHFHFQRQSTLNIHCKDWCWSWSSNTLAIWFEQLTHWKRPWCWERLKAKGEGGDRGWDGWMASPIQWAWTWANSKRWWGTWRPGIPQSMGSQRVGHDLVNKHTHGQKVQTSSYKIKYL